jgi:hypothetical protein
MVAVHATREVVEVVVVGATREEVVVEAMWWRW